VRGTRATPPDPVSPRGESPSLIDGIGDAINSEWSVAWLAKRLARPSYELDPQFDMFAPGVFESLTEGLQPAYAEMIGEAQSMEHATALRARALKQQESQDRLASMGWGGTALRFAAAMTDPAAIAIGVATGGSAWAARGATSLARFSRAGVLAAAANLPIDATIVSQDPTLENDTILLGAGAGFFLGGLGGLVGGRAAVEGERIAARAREIRANLAEFQPAMGAASARSFTPEARALEAIRKQSDMAELSPESISTLEYQGAREAQTGVGFAAKVYRGVGAGRDPLDTKDTVGNALFFAVDKGTASIYGDPTKGGTLLETGVRLQSPLVAQNWVEAKNALGLPKSATMADLIASARLAGHDGIIYTFKNNTKVPPELVVLDPSRIAPVTPGKTIIRELAGLSVAEREEALTIMHRAAGLSDEELPRFVENMMAMDPKQVDDILRGNPYQSIDLPSRDPNLKPPTDDEIAARAGQILAERPDLTPEVAAAEARKQIDFENAAGNNTKAPTNPPAEPATPATPKPPSLPPEPPRPAKLATDFRPMNGTDAAAVGPRADLAGTTGKSQSGFARFVSSTLFFDPILRAGKNGMRALNDAATAWHQRTVEGMLARYTPGYHVPMKQFLRTQGFDRFGRRAEGEATFSRNVARAVRNDEVFARSLPEVQAAAKAVRAQRAEELGMLQRHGVRNAYNIAENKNSLPRIYNAAAINRFIAKSDKDKVVEFVAKAITSGRNDLDLQIEEGLTRRVAAAIVDRAIGKKGTDFNGAMTLDPDTLRAILREDVKDITEDQIDQVAFRLLAGKAQDGVPGSLKRRAVLDESFEDVIDGVGSVHVDDLFINDIPTLLHHSARNTAGLSAEATILDEAKKYFTALTGKEADFNTWASLRSALSRAGASDLDLKRLDVGWRHLRGIPHDSLTGSILRDIPALNDLRQGVMAYNYATGQGGFVLAAINEIARIPALFGTQQFFRQIPAMVEMFGRRADGSYNDEFVRQLVGMGIIQDHKYSHQLAARADFTDVLDTRTGRNADRTIRGLRSISNFASRATGLDKADQIGRLLAVRTMMQSLTDEARGWKRAVDDYVAQVVKDAGEKAVKAAGKQSKEAIAAIRSAAEASVDIKKARVQGELYIQSSSLSAKDLGFLGLTEADTRAVFRALTGDKAIVKIDAGGKFDGFTIDLNAMKDDLSAKLVQSMARAADGAIQVADVGSLPGWLVQSPLARTVFQFRSFAIAAWPRQTLRFAQTLDEKAAWKTALYGSLIPTLTYYGRTQLEASMMDEKRAKKYLDERLTLKNLAAIGVAQNGISSIAPMMVDNVAGFTPMGPIFANARYSGLGAYGLAQNPSMDLVNTVGRTAGNLLELPFVKGDRFTQNEFDTARKLVPLQNALPLKPFWESLRRQFPESNKATGEFRYAE
jgi:hypothetical protein